LGQDDQHGAETVWAEAFFRSAFPPPPLPGSGRWVLRARQAQGKQQPYYIQMRDGQPFVFAGLWEWQGQMAVLSILAPT